MKILKNKEYQRLKDIEEKYNFLTGQSFVMWTGFRSRYKTLLNTPKEQLVKMYFELNNHTIKLQKELKKKNN